VTITVTANPYSTPPRNEITVSVPAGNIMQTASLNRIVNGVATPTRTQPATGFDSQIVYDYESPRDVPVAYEFASTYYNPAATTVWDETWANLSNWTVVHSGFAVSSGTVTATAASTSTATITRAVTSGLYRVVVSSLASTATPSILYQSGVFFSNTAGTTLFGLVPLASGLVSVAIPNSGAGFTLHPTSIHGNASVTVDFLGSTAVVSGTGGNYTVTGRGDVSFSLVTVNATNSTTTGATTTVGEIKITQSAPVSSSDETSVSVALSPLNSWVVHPSNPSLSMPISSTDQTALMIRSIGDVTNGSASTEHTILGESLPITTTSGPRYGNRLQMVIGCRTRTQELALNALLADGTPLLFLFPASFNVGFDEGFYSVGDVTRARWAQRPGFEKRDFTLPLTQVKAPVVVVQNTGWSWASVAATFASWSVLPLAYNSWADAQVDNRNAGY
jgi:hypothetical protein